MVTHLPHGLQKLLEVTVGMPWPEGDEGDLWDLASAWDTFGGELDSLATELTTSAGNFGQAIQGEAGDKLKELLAVQLHDGATQLKDQADAYSKMVRNAAADIQKTKIMIIGMLAILAATIAWLLASLFGSFAIPSVIAAARVGIGVLLRSLISRLMEVGLMNIARSIVLKAVIGGVVGAGFMVGLDAGIQGGQIAAGKRNGWDTESLKGSAIGGVIGGALGGAAEGFAGALGKIGKNVWEHMPRSVRGFAPLGSTMLQIPAAALSNPIINKATHSPGNAIDGVFGALDPGGGGHARPKIPHVDMPDIKPIGDLSLLPSATPVSSAPTTGTPVTNPGGGTIGSAFSQPNAPRTQTPSWLTGGTPVRQEVPSGQPGAAPQVPTQGSTGAPGPAAREGTPATRGTEATAVPGQRTGDRQSAPETQRAPEAQRPTTSGTPDTQGGGDSTRNAGTRQPSTSAPRTETEARPSTSGEGRTPGTGQDSGGTREQNTASRPVEQTVSDDGRGRQGEAPSSTRQSQPQTPAGRDDTQSPSQTGRGNPDERGSGVPQQTVTEDGRSTEQGGGNQSTAPTRSGEQPLGTGGTRAATPAPPTTSGGRAPAGDAPSTSGGRTAGQQAASGGRGAGNPQTTVGGNPAGSPTVPAERGPADGGAPARPQTTGKIAGDGGAPAERGTATRGGRGVDAAGEPAAAPNGGTRPSQAPETQGGNASGSKPGKEAVSGDQVNGKVSNTVEGAAPTAAPKAEQPVTATRPATGSPEVRADGKRPVVEQAPGATPESRTTPATQSQTGTDQPARKPAVESPATVPAEATHRSGKEPMAGESAFVQKEISPDVVRHADETGDAVDRSEPSPGDDGYSDGWLERRAAEQRVPPPPGPVDRADHARVERPKVAGDIDGSAVRKSILDLLNLKDGRTGRVVRAMVEQQFSDENLKAKFHRTLDGGLVVDLGPRAHSAPQVRLEVTGLSSPQQSRRTSVDFSEGHSRESAETSLSNARAAYGTDPRLFRLPVARVFPQLKLVGLTNTRGSDLTSKLSHGGSTTVTESAVPAESAKHDVSYRVTVRKPRSFPWSKATTATDVAWAEVPLEWPRRDLVPSIVDPVAKIVPPKEIAHAELTGIGDIYHQVEESLGGFPASHPGAGKFRDWLHTLPASAPQLLSGEPVRRSFKFPGTGRVEVMVSVADVAVTRPLAAATGTLQHTKETSVEHSVGQSHGRRWGASATVMIGDLTGATGWAVGPTALMYGSTRTETRATGKFRRQLSDKYEGPVGKQQLRFSYVVRVGDVKQAVPAPDGDIVRDHVAAPATTGVDPAAVRHYRPDQVFKVDGSATVWTKPDQGGRSVPPPAVADPGVPGRVPVQPEERPKVDPARVLDQLDADHRLPEETVAHLIGPVLYRLSGDGVVSAKDLPEIERRFRTFLQDQARELVRGADGVRFPLSSWQKNAPDVFVRGTVQVDQGRYLGTIERETRSGLAASGHKDTTEVTRGRDLQGGVSATAYDGEAHHKDYRQAGSTLSYKNNRRFIRNVEHEIGVERPIAGDLPLHKVRYPVEFDVRIGGRWGDPAETLYSRGSSDGPVSVYRGDVDVVAAERAADAAGARPEPETGGSIWHDGEPDGGGHRAARLPAGFQLEALKPVPKLLSTVTEMIDAPPASRYAEWIRRPLVGTKPARFDEHKGLGVWGREPDVPDERNAARDVLENFASLPARAGGFERSALHHDTVVLKSHNRSGLVGNRERVARVDLATHLANARIIGVDEAHRFSTTEVASAEWKSEIIKGDGVKLKADLADVLPIPPLAKTVSPFVTVAGAAMIVRKDGESSGAGVRETVTRSHTERGYLVSFDATYGVRTSMQGNWHDFLGIRHDGTTREAAKQLHVPEAATVWVPASEIHRIGDLLPDDVAKLDSGEARAYRQERTTEPGPATRAGEEPVREPDPVAAPSNVGRGSGRVELHRLESGAELVDQVATRLREWAAKRSGNPEPSMIDLTRQVFGLDVPERPTRRTVEFGPINERLVRDVLGPSLAGSEFNPVLKEMLAGGHPVYLEGATLVGKVEQLVVLRAELGPGAYRRTVVGEEIKGETTRTDRTGSTSLRGLWSDWSLGLFTSSGQKHKPSSSTGIAWSGVHKVERRTELGHERGETVSSARTSDSAEFLHDLRITMDVYPYARAGHYTKFLPGSRHLETPWSTEFALPDAVRSSVPLDETIPVGGRPEPALAETTGSLRQEQRKLGLKEGLSGDAVVRVRPLDVPRLHESVHGLMRGDGDRPLLHPRAIHQLQSGTGSLPLRSHLRELLSNDGYVVKMSGDALKQVKITADIVKRELVRVLDEPLESKTTETDTAKRSLVHTGEMAPESFGNLGAPHQDGSTQRPAMLVGDGYTPWAEWGHTRDASSSTSKDVKKTFEDGDSAPKQVEEKHYLVRLTPQWTIEPTYRSSRVPSAWKEAIRTEPDNPILIEIDRAGLKELGLADPKENASRPVSLNDFLDPRREPEIQPEADVVRRVEDTTDAEPETVREDEIVREDDDFGIDDHDTTFDRMMERLTTRQEGQWPAWRTLETIVEVDEDWAALRDSPQTLAELMSQPVVVPVPETAGWPLGLWRNENRVESSAAERSGDSVTRPAVPRNTSGINNVLGLGRAKVIDGVTLTGFDRATRQQVTFHSSRVRVHRMYRQGQVAGISFSETRAVGSDLKFMEGENYRNTFLLREGYKSADIGRASRENALLNGPSPWPENTFYVTTHGLTDRFLTRLADGRQVWVDGENFGRLVHDLRSFRDGVAVNRPAALALVICYVGELDGPGGAAFDFQRALSRLGHDQTVVAATQSMGYTVSGSAYITNGGTWRHFSSGQAKVLGSDSVVAGKWAAIPVEGNRETALVRDGRLIGTSYRNGEGLTRTLDWVASGARAAETPWPRRTFFVDTVSSVDGRFEVHAADGTSHFVEGSSFGRVVAKSQVFREAMAGPDRPQALALLVSEASFPRIGGRDSGLDFSKALEREFDAPLPVYAVTGTTEFRRGRDGEPVLHVWGGDWVRHSDAPETPRAGSSSFEDGDVPGPADFETDEIQRALTERPVSSQVRGIDVVSHELVEFSAADMRFHRLDKADGTPMGILLTARENLRENLARAKLTYTGTTELYGRGILNEQDIQNADRDYEVREVPAPWPDNAFYVVTHGMADGFEVELAAGRTVGVPGETFARLVHELDVFRASMDALQPAAVTLLVCAAGAMDKPGGAGHDFQRALGQLGYRQPVIAATKQVGWHSFDDGTWSTYVVDGGSWRTLSSERSRLLGQTKQGRWVSFDPVDIPATPLVHDGRTVGAAYRKPGARLDERLEWAEAGALFDGEVPWSRRAFFVDVKSASNGLHLNVTTVDGVRLTVDSRAFGQVVVNSQVFRDAMGDAASPDSLVLLASEEHAGQFMRALERDFGDRPVYTPSEDVEFVAGMDDRPVLSIDEGEWVRHGGPRAIVDSRRAPGDEPAIEHGEGSGEPATSGVFEDVDLVGLDPRSGAEIAFRSSEVVHTSMTRDGRLAGVTFRQGSGREVDLAWARGTQADETYLFEGGRGTGEPAIEARPWSDDTFFVSAAGTRQQLARIELADGTKLAVDGPNLAALLHDLAPFRSTVDAQPADSVTLLVAHASAVDGHGGLAHDFQATLAGAFGRREPVFAPSNRIEPQVFEDGSATTVITNGGRWETFARPAVVDDIVLSGFDKQTRTPIAFRSSEVQLGSMVHRGTAIGATFMVGAERAFDDSWSRAGKSGETYRFPDKYEPGKAYADDALVVEPNPWPDNTFYVTTHGSKRGTVTVHLTDGTGVRIDGGTFARLVNDIGFVRAALDRDQPDAITMLVCYAGKIDGPGGTAHDFQQVLASEFGYRQPVFGGTTIAENLLFADEMAGTGLDHYGEWRRFPGEVRPVAVPAPDIPESSAEPMGLREFLTGGKPS